MSIMKVGTYYLSNVVYSLSDEENNKKSGMNKAIFSQLALRGKSIEVMTDQDKKHLFMFSSMASDLNILGKFLLFNGKNKNKTGLKAAEFTALHLFFFLLLIGKLNEIWVYIKDVEGEGKKELENVFSGNVNTLFHTLRDKLCFHYDAHGDYDAVFSELVGNLGDLRVWSSAAAPGNDLFPWLDETKLAFLFKEVRGMGREFALMNDQRLSDYLFTLVLNATRSCQKFCEDYLKKLYGGVDCQVIQEEEVSLPGYSEVSLNILAVKED